MRLDAYMCQNIAKKADNASRSSKTAWKSALKFAQKCGKSGKMRYFEAFGGLCGLCGLWGLWAKESGTALLL